MKVTVIRKTFREAVSGLGKIVSPKTTLPVLGCVRFDLDYKGLTATGTDMDQHATYRFPESQTEGRGTFLLPLVALKELAKGKDGETLDFESGSDGQVTITNHVGGHDVRTPMVGLDVDEWPTNMPTVETKQAEGFLETYRRLLPFASDDSTRYVLNGVYVDVAEKGTCPITMVATDGRRLTACNSMVLPITKGVIVPTRKFLAWSGLDGLAAVGVRTMKDMAWFGLQIGPWTYATRTVDGTYPNWRQVVPVSQDAEGNCVTFTDEDAQALKKILPGFPGHDTQSNAIGLHPGKSGLLTISGRGPDDKKDTVLELTGGSQCQGKDPTGIDRAFLLEALDAGFRQFKYADSLSPLYAKDGPGIHVLMPIRLSNDPVKSSNNETPVTKTTPPADGQTGKTETEETMPNEKDKTQPEPTALDKLMTAYELAKTKIKEANQALTDVASAIKDAAREDRQRRIEVESVRAGLAKLQQIKV